MKVKSAQTSKSQKYTIEENIEFAEGDLQELIEMFCIKFKKSNPRFSEIRFRDWIEKGLYE